MDNIISLQDTSKCLKEQNESLDTSIKTLLEHDNRLRSYMVLQMLVSKAECALSQMKDEIPDIEKRLLAETEDICKQAKQIIAGLKTHSECFKEVIDALGNLCKDTDLATRNIEIHNQIDEMNEALNVLIEKRNNIPIDQLR